MKSPLTTLCYIEQDGRYLMLHRVSKKKDVNKGKWIGVGGHFEEGESPEECLLREVREETGLTLTSWRFRGLLTFEAKGWPSEYICLYTADGFTGELTGCSEGSLAWIPKEEVLKLNLWEGDLIFLRLLLEDAPFFSMKLCYDGDILQHAALDGRELELLDVCDENGVPTGRITERGTAHSIGLPHRTVHIWLARRRDNGWQVLLQKRSRTKESFPGRYDTSCAGHVQAGCGYLESALRELSEELGLTVAAEELREAGSVDSGDVILRRVVLLPEEQAAGKMEDVEADARRMAMLSEERASGRMETVESDAQRMALPPEKQAAGNGDQSDGLGRGCFHDREIAEVYVCIRDVEEEELRLQTEEVESVRWMELDACLAAMEAGDERYCVKNLPCLRLARKLLEE